MVTRRTFCFNCCVIRNCAILEIKDSVFKSQWLAGFNELGIMGFSGAICVWFSWGLEIYSVPVWCCVMQSRAPRLIVCFVPQYLCI